MPEGLQDWYLRNQINIIAQDIAELIQRPKYGAAQFFDPKVDCPANETTSLLTIFGKGFLYWARFAVPASEYHGDDRIYLYLEDGLICWYSFSSALGWQINAPYKGTMYIIEYDEIAYNYSMGIGPGITFESKMEFRYKNNTDVEQRVGGGVLYAII